jgi:hypothetical protein
MSLTFRPLHPRFVAEASSIDLRSVHEIWDNRATMHRARPFDDTRYRREMRRVTTLDIEPSAVVPSAS